MRGRWSLGYDLVILGGGAAAFAALTEASGRGLSTTLVNTGLPLGGTCVNVGGVPSKHLLEVAKTAFEPPRNPFEAVEYDEDEPMTDWATALDEKDRLVAQLREQNYVDVVDHFETDVYEGYGRFTDGEGQSPSSSRAAPDDDTTIEIVDGDAEGTTITGKKVLIATGSSPWIASIDGIEDIHYETSETILERRDLPESIIMIGGGYIGLEWGQILHHMGTDVTILQRSEHVLSKMEGQLGRELQCCFEAEGQMYERLGADVTMFQRGDRLLPQEEPGVSTVIQEVFESEGIDVQTNVSVEQLESTDSGIEVSASEGGETTTVDASHVLIATGRQPNSDKIGLDRTDVETERDSSRSTNSSRLMRTPFGRWVTSSVGQCSPIRHGTTRISSIDISSRTRRLTLTIGSSLMPSSPTRRSVASD